MNDVEGVIAIFSWVGALILLFRALPQAYKSWKEGHSNGLAPSMLWLWLIGSFCLLPHLLSKGDWATAIIYFSNIFAVIIMGKFFYFPRISNQEHINKKGD